MAYSITALELVNRVLRRMRDETVGGVVDPRGAVILDIVNAAKDDVLTSRDWDFDLRHDGALVTRPHFSSTTANLTQHNSVMSDTELVGHTLDPPSTPPLITGDVICRIEYEGDTTTANEEASLVGTIWKVLKADAVITPNATLDAEWPGATTSTAKVRYFMSEYILPDTVRDVVSVTNQNGVPLDLDHVDPGATFDRIIPDVTERFGRPEIAAVGGLDVETFFVGQTVTPRLRMALFPVPDDEFRLNYSYYYNHPDLMNDTDTLTGVRPNVVASIVDRAVADAVQSVERRVRDGSILESNAERRLGRKFDSQNLQPAKRNNMRSWESGSRGRPRSVANGFPGVTITDS